MSGCDLTTSPAVTKCARKYWQPRKLKSMVEKETRILVSRHLYSGKNHVAISKIRLFHETDFISRLLLVLLMSYSR